MSSNNKKAPQQTFAISSTNDAVLLLLMHQLRERLCTQRNPGTTMLDNGSLFLMENAANDLEGVPPVSDAQFSGEFCGVEIPLAAGYDNLLEQ